MMGWHFDSSVAVRRSRKCPQSTATPRRCHARPSLVSGHAPHTLVRHLCRHFRDHVPSRDHKRVAHMGLVHALVRHFCTSDSSSRSTLWAAWKCCRVPAFDGARKTVTLGIIALYRPPSRLSSHLIPLRSPFPVRGSSYVAHSLPFIPPRPTASRLQTGL